ncbi:hypothetical protein [Corynebacterium singulare]|nr:hypothetical protein [Corynebacterium singulare]
MSGTAWLDAFRADAEREADLRDGAGVVGLEGEEAKRVWLGRRRGR